MQTTTTLPIQVSPASAPRSASAGQNADAAQFAQALSREMDQRQPSPAPQASRQPSPARQQSAPAPRPQTAQAQEQAKPAEAGPAQAKPADAAPADSKSASTGSDSADAAKDDAAAAAASAPLADMLALVASFNQPAVATAPVAPNAAGAADTLQAAALGGEPVQQAVPGADTGAEKAALLAGGAPSFKEVAKAIDLKALGDAAANGADAGDAVGTQADAPSELTGATPATAEAKAPASADNKLAALAMPAQAADGASGTSNSGAIAGSASAALPHAEAALRAPEPAALKEGPVAAPLIAPMTGPMASASIAQAVTGVPADRLGARVGTPAWDNQVGQKIIWMVAGKEQSASLTLNPPDLGPMQVVLNVTNDQASVTFTAAQPEVRQALENAMPKLREMMSDNGIALGNATVNAGMPDQRQAQQGEQSRGQAAHARFGGNLPDGVQGLPLAPARQVRTDGSGLVDTFA